MEIKPGKGRLGKYVYFPALYLLSAPLMLFAVAVMSLVCIAVSATTVHRIVCNAIHRSLDVCSYKCKCQSCRLNKVRTFD